MYGVLLLTHSWLRWGVLLTAAVVLVRALTGLIGRRAFGRVDRRWMAVFLGAFDTQALLGLLLYFVFSPITPSSLAELKSRLHDRYLRFFGLEHITMMGLALVVVHFGWVLCKKGKTARAQHRRLAFTVLLGLLLVLAAIPWPGRPGDRPLFRLLTISL